MNIIDQDKIQNEMMLSGLDPSLVDILLNFNQIRNVSGLYGVSEHHITSFDSDILSITPLSLHI